MAIPFSQKLLFDEVKGAVKGVCPPSCSRSSFNGVTVSTVVVLRYCQHCRVTRPYMDAQDRLLCRDLFCMCLAHHQPERVKTICCTSVFCYPFMLLTSCHYCALMIVLQHQDRRTVRRLQEHPCGCKCPKPTSPTGCGS